MLNVPRPSCVRTLLLCLAATLTASTAHAQIDTSTPLTRLLDHVDFAVSGVAVFTKNSSGTVTVNTQPTPLTLTPGSTLGALVTLRYIKSPYIGFEGNFGYARYTQKFNTIGGVQNNVKEYTLGYVAHPPVMFGVNPFLAVGAGTTAFHPTTGGGQSLSGAEQARATYYYSIGAEK